jgi:heterodisulfide reductase subunit A
MAEPRIGVFICGCGNNIASVVDISQVVNYAKELSNVIFADKNSYMCSEEGLKLVKTKISEKRLQRVVLGACTPRTHETLFRNTCQQAGLNKYLFEFVNLREQCSWIHSQEPLKATLKAKDLISMGVAKARLLEPKEDIEVSVKPKAIIVGGGISGITSALKLASLGFKIDLIEKQRRLGGNLNNLAYVFPTLKTSQEILEPLLQKIYSSPFISLHLESKIREVKGTIGDFQVKIENPQGCQELKAGVIIITTGTEELKPYGMYGYKKIPAVLTLLELEDMLLKDTPLPESIAMILCVGARLKERPYCSKICCTSAIKNALLIKKKNSNTSLFILSRDIVTTGIKAEALYQEALSLGVKFLRYEGSIEVKEAQKKKRLRFYYPFIKREMVISTDLVVLVPPLIPSPETKKLSSFFKVPLSQDGFFQEAHPKLEPVKTSCEGIYLAGSCRFPTFSQEATTQSLAAASKAAIPLIKGKVKAEPIFAFCDPNICIGCGSCEEVCPFSAIEIRKENSGYLAHIHEIKCKGCGSCLSVCRTGAMHQNGFEDHQIISMIEAYASNDKKKDEFEPKIIVFACNWCSYAGADLAGISRLQIPLDFRIIRLMCSSRVKSELVIGAFVRGIDGVMILGCHPGECHYIHGNMYAQKRISILRWLLEEFGVDKSRLIIEWVSASEGSRFKELIEKTILNIKALGNSKNLLK